MDEAGMKRLLVAAEKGVSYLDDRSKVPAVCSISQPKPSDLTTPADVLFWSIDEGVAGGLVSESSYKGFTHVFLTWKGRKEFLRLTDFDMKKWAQWMDSHVALRCCERALPYFCVCSQATQCDVHGDKHHGTHD